MTSPRYETTNICLASFLLSQGAVLTDSVRVAPRRIAFWFAADEQLHELLRLYWSKAPVTLVPGRLFASLRYLKSLIRGHDKPATLVP